MAHREAFLGVCKSYDVYHVTVMPCYDDKLEVVQDHFTFSIDSKEATLVESVLTTGEVLELIHVATWYFYFFWFVDLKNKGDLT
jgi:iron only hydrogenase large subunit-like protein